MTKVYVLEDIGGYGYGYYTGDNYIHQGERYAVTNRDIKKAKKYKSKKSQKGIQIIVLSRAEAGDAGKQQRYQMTKKQESINSSWLYVILILFCLFGAVSLVSTLETSKVKREQIKIYNRINNMEKALTTKDKELESYLIKEKMK